MSTVPVYLVGLTGPVLDACRAAFGERAQALPSPGDWRALAQRPAGLVLLSPDACPASELVEAAEVLGGADWVLGLVDGEGTHWVRSVSVGRSETLQAAALHAADAEATPGTLLALEQVLTEIARARHEINNPLTSALAETQILLMDAPEGETREALLQIQTQLRRIRDLLIATRHLRPGG